MTYTTHTRVIVVDARKPDPAAIQQAAETLRAGRLVAFPTETVYGLGANALDSEAVARIYSAKGRPAYNPLIVHIASPDQLDRVAVAVPDLARRLAEAFWPGPLTLVLKRHPHIPDNVSLGRDTVAVRLPSHPVAQALIAAAGVPVVAPSANRFTRPSATTAQHVIDDLTGHVDVILDGGPTPIGVESTVLDLTTTPPLVLRPGGVTIEALRAVIPDVQRYSSMVPLDDSRARPASPGMLLKHYSPQAEVLLFNGPFEAVIEAMRRTAQKRRASGQRVGIFAPDADLRRFADLDVQSASLGGDMEQFAQRLFAGLRALDEQGVDVILARLLKPAGLGATVNDRLLRAAEGRVIEIHEEEGGDDDGSSTD
jgi:L-threonylcarbamoyladenylate synthase